MEEKRAPWGPWTAERVRDYVLTMRKGETAEIKTKPKFTVTRTGDSVGAPLVTWKGGGKKGKGITIDLVDAMEAAGALKESIADRGEGSADVDFDTLFTEAAAEENGGNGDEEDEGGEGEEEEEGVSGEELIKQLKAIAASGEDGEVNGEEVDNYTAQAVTTLYKALTPENKTKFLTKSLPEMIAICEKVMAEED